MTNDNRRFPTLATDLIRITSVYGHRHRVSATDLQLCRERGYNLCPLRCRDGRRISDLERNQRPSALPGVGYIHMENIQ